MDYHDVEAALEAATFNYGQNRDVEAFEEGLRTQGHHGPSEAVEMSLDAALRNYGESVDIAVLAENLEQGGWR